MVWIDKIFAKLLFWLYDFLDAICEIFSILAGTETFTYEGDENVSLIDVFVEHSAITQVFLAVFLVSIAVVAIFTIVGMVKNVIAIKAENRHTQGHTLGLGLTALLASLLMFAVLLMGIQLSNEVLCLVNQAFGGGSDMSLSQQLFEISVSETYDKVEISPDDAELEDYVVIDDGNILYVLGDGSLQKYYNESQSLYYYMINGTWKPETACELCASSALVYISGGVQINGYHSFYEGDYTESAFQDVVYGGVEYGDWYANYDEDNEVTLYVAYIYDGSARAVTSGWQNGYTASDIDFSSMTVDDVFGVYGKTIGFESYSNGLTSASKNTRMVDLSSFNLFTAYLAVIIILVALVWAMIGLVKRIYDILFMIVILPLITATLPIDEGARFKAWRDTMASKVLLAYGAVISVNIFLIMLPIIGGICDAIYFTTKFSGKILEIMLYAGGALSISGGQLLLARLLGTDASESRDLANSARTALGVAGGVAGTTAAAAGIGKRAIFGGQNKYGRTVKGAIPAALTPVNAAAEKIGGERYMQSRAGSAMRTLGRVENTEARAKAAKTGSEQRAAARAAKKTTKAENREQGFEQKRVAKAEDGKLKTQEEIISGDGGKNVQTPEKQTPRDPVPPTNPENESVSNLTGKRDQNTGTSVNQGVTPTEGAVTPDGSNIDPVPTPTITTEGGNPVKGVPESTTNTLTNANKERDPVQGDNPEAPKFTDTRTEANEPAETPTAEAAIATPQGIQPQTVQQGVNNLPVNQKTSEPVPSRNPDEPAVPPAPQAAAVTPQTVSSSANPATPAMIDGGAQQTDSAKTSVINITQPNPLTGSRGIESPTNNSKHAKELVGNTLGGAKNTTKGGDAPGATGEGDK